MSSDWHHLDGFIRSNQNKEVALATLIKVEGSSYRQPGARLLITADGSYSGSLSGGCLEEGVSEVAKEVIEDGVARTKVINTEPYFGCPGILTILIEPLVTGELLPEILEKLSQRKPFCLYTSATKTTLTPEESPLLTETVPLVPRLLIVGWTTDQEPLCQIANTLHWETHRLVKDDAIFKSLTPISGETVSVCAAEELAEKFSPDNATAILIMSHHMMTDLEFLKAAVTLDYPYIGLLGSRRRREKLLHELGDAGLLDNLSWVDRFYAPVGLDLGGQHPTTISLSILAEIQACFTGAPALPLTEKVGRIHNQSTCP